MYIHVQYIGNIDIELDIGMGQNPRSLVNMEMAGIAEYSSA